MVVLIAAFLVLLSVHFKFVMLCVAKLQNKKRSGKKDVRLKNQSINQSKITEQRGDI